MPPLVFHGLSGHDSQAHLDLHYVMMPLALTFVAAALGLRNLSRAEGVALFLRSAGSPRTRAVAGALVMLAITAAVFWTSSPYSPNAETSRPSDAHLAVVDEALQLIPSDAPVAAQSTIFPHLSQRRAVFEFPRVEQAEYAVIDSNLPVSSHEREEGYDAAAQDLPGFQEIFDSDGVRVFQRLP